MPSKNKYIFRIILNSIFKPLFYMFWSYSFLYSVFIHFKIKFWLLSSYSLYSCILYSCVMLIPVYAQVYQCVCMAVHSVVCHPRFEEGPESPPLLFWGHRLKSQGTSGIKCIMTVKREGHLINMSFKKTLKSCSGVC